MAKKFPSNPPNPERICWGCDKYCPTDSLACGNGSDRTQHPIEFFGKDWQSWGLDAVAGDDAETEAPQADAASGTPLQPSPDPAKSSRADEKSSAGEIPIEPTPALEV